MESLSEFGTSFQHLCRVFSFLYIVTGHNFFKDLWNYAIHNHNVLLEYGHYYYYQCIGPWGQIPSPLTGWLKSILAYRVKVDSGIGLPMVNVLESTLDIRWGNSQLWQCSHKPCLSLDSASVKTLYYDFALSGVLDCLSEVRVVNPSFRLLYLCWNLSFCLLADVKLLFLWWLLSSFILTDSYIADF